MRLPRPGETIVSPGADVHCMGLHAGQLVPVLAASVVVWLALVLGTLVGRAGYDRRRRSVAGVAAPPRRGSRRERLLLRRAASVRRTEAGRWRRIGALRELARIDHPACRTLLPAALEDADPEIAGAAVRSLGDVGAPWAIAALVGALQTGTVSRSRVAVQLERLAPAPGPLLVPLLDDHDPAVRFWAATLLGPYGALATTALLRHARDADADVRAAVAETLASRSGKRARAAALALLDDPAWFVRVHAARTVGCIGAPEDIAHVVPLLSDGRWWVRSAAKDALRTLAAADAAAVLLPVLDGADEFARNGAAEVLQDVGYVDELVAGGRDAVTLERIFAAGGDRMRRLAADRAEAIEPEARERKVA